MRRIGLILAALLTLAGFLACGDTTSTPPATAVTGTVASIPTAAPHFKVKDQVRAANWLVVVNSAKSASTDDGTFHPAAGNTFIILDLTVQNLATTADQMNVFYFTLRAADGTAYQPGPSNLADISSTVVAGGKDHGFGLFEVPKAAKTFTLEFAPNGLDIAAIWDISV